MIDFSVTNIFRLFSAKNHCTIFFVLLFTFTADNFSEASEPALPVQQLEPVTLQLKWEHQFQFAGYYAAQHKGFFQQEGLKVTIKAGGADVKVDQEVIAGKAEYGVLAAELIHKRIEGHPLVLLAVIMQHSVRGIIVKTDSGIASPADLADKKLMLNRNEDIEFMAMFIAEGVPMDRLHIIDKDASALDKFIHGEIDAFNGSIGNQPFFLQNKGIAVEIICPINYGIDFYGDSLFTSEREVKDHPERAAAFRRAVLRGWEYALANPGEIIELIISRYNPDISREHLENEAKHLRRVIDPDIIEIGHINPHRIKRIAQIIAESNSAPQNYTLEGFIFSPADYNTGISRKFIYGALIITGIMVFCGLVMLLLYNRLKTLVKRRTRELIITNENLLNEIETRKKAELSIAQNEAKFRSIIESSTDAIIIANAHGIITGVNHSAEKLFGYGLGEMDQLNLTMLMPKRYRDQHASGVERVVETKESTYLGQTLEFHGLTKNGKEFPLELNVATWFVGSTQYFSGIIRDVSERKKAENALRESEEQLSIIFNSTHDGILLADTATKKFLTGNKTICEMLGYTLEEITELRVDDIHPPDRLAEVKKHFEQQARNEIEVYHNAPVMRKDGSVFLADISASPTVINQKPYLIGLFRDATQRNEVEQKILQSQKLEAMGTLAGGIAHDFNNILSAILGYSEMILTGIHQGDKHFNDVQQIIKAGNRARELVNQILTFSRQSSSERIPLRLQTIIKEALKLLRSTLPTTIRIEQDICQQCSPIIADPTQIHQVMMNLCTNAFHAMEDSGGVVHISLREIEITHGSPEIQHDLQPGRYVELVVQDTGPGIQQDIISQIFDPYFTTKPQEKGSGLGLSVVHGIVENHGGKITCSGREGSGAVFTLYFPAVDAPAQVEQEISTDLPGGNEQILFVDDETSIVELHEQILESLGYSVEAFDSSIDAWELFSSEPEKFDLIITDQTMPHMTGSELAEKMLQISPGMPIILCTGHSSVIDENAAKKIGIKSFLMKPVDKRMLAGTIRNLLDGNGDDG